MFSACLTLTKSYNALDVQHIPGIITWFVLPGLLHEANTTVIWEPMECKNHLSRYGDTHYKEKEIKFIGLFGDRGHRGPYSPYKPCNHNLYIGIIIFPHIDNPQSTGYNQPKKKTIKIINEKSEGPINLTNHWRKRLWVSLHVDLKRLN